MSGGLWRPVDQLAWLEASGPESGLVVSTRVRLARNLRDFPFRCAAPAPSGGQADGVASSVEAVLAGIGTMHRLGTLTPLEQQLLQERQQVSAELVQGEHGRAGGEALLVGPEASAMVNEEDHLRLQGLASGFDLRAAHGAADRLDTALGDRLSFAFHPEFGYLTSCPTNVGTGLRASVLIHLPGLVMAGEMTQLMRGLGHLGLTHRGWHGEGSDMLGHLVQLSNQTTLGRSEDDLLNHLERLVRQVMEYEARARDVLWRDAPAVIEDRIWRAWGVLRYARRLSLEEAIDRLSLVRLGVVRGVLPAVPVAVLNRLLVEVQAAHVAQRAGIGLDDEALTSHRAALMRDALAEKGKGR